MTGKLVLFAIPLILVMGFVGVLVSGQFALPSGSAFLSALSHFDGVEAINNLGTLIRNWNDAIDTAFGAINNIGDFFNAIGAFFNAFGQFIAVVFTIIRIPFDVLGWFFQNVWRPVSV